MRQMLQNLCVFLAVLCLLYYGVIVLYVGWSADFAWIWLLGAAGFVCLRALLFWQERNPGIVPKLGCGAAFLLAAALLLCMMCVGSRVFRAMYREPETGAEYMLVLGAQVNGTAPSRALRKRLDRAIAYAEENPDTKLVLSGGKGDDEEISEAACMYRYLTERGIAPGRLLCEDRSTSTRENLRFSDEQYALAGKKVGILSNNFHLYRALKLAGEEGYTDVFGIAAPSDPILQVHYVLREICALMADWVF